MGAAALTNPHSFLIFFVLAVVAAASAGIYIAVPRLFPKETQLFVAPPISEQFSGRDLNTLPSIAPRPQLRSPADLMNERQGLAVLYDNGPRLLLPHVGSHIPRTATPARLPSSVRPPSVNPFDSRHDTEPNFPRLGSSVR